VDALMDAGACGIVVAGMSPGTCGPLQLAALERAAQNGIVAHFHPDGISDLCDNIEGGLLLFAEERIEKAGFADVMAQFAMLEKDVHRFPERVVKDFDQFLMHEGIFNAGLQAIGATHARQSECHCVS